MALTSPIFSEMEVINFNILGVISYGGFNLILSFDSTKYTIQSANNCGETDFFNWAQRSCICFVAGLRLIRLALEASA